MVRISEISNSHRAIVASVAIVAIGAGVSLGLVAWPEPQRTFEFAGLIAAALLLASFRVQNVAARDWATMAPSFVIDFSTLLLLGPEAAIVVAGAGAIMQASMDSQRWQAARRLAINASTVMVAMLAAGYLYVLAVGNLREVFRGFIEIRTWPGRGLPIAFALIAYGVVKSAMLEILVPLATRQPINREWPHSVLRGMPVYFIGASIAVGIVTIVELRAWQVVPVAAVPLYFAYRAYCAHVIRYDEDKRRLEVIDSLEHGMSVIDTDGVLTLWNDGVERIFGYADNAMMGQGLVDAIPALSKTKLPQVITEVLTSGTPQTIAQLRLTVSEEMRTLKVQVIPVAGGATLLWEDVTERAGAEQALRRNEERLALAVEGANDGLWEWDLRSQEFYSSGRWKAMLGVDAPAGVGAIADWFERVHTDDRAELKARLEEHLAGKTEQLHHVHRIRHTDGTYRRILCRSIAVRGTGRNQVRIAGSMTDITERAQPVDRVEGAGSIDPLTGLGNRAVFVERLGRRLEEFKSGRLNKTFAALYLDLDRFKIVNDNLGHLVGDELLTAASRRLEACLRQGDALARLGGDEFAILLNELGDANQANAIAFRIQESLSAPFSIGGREVFTSASIGIACGQAQYSNPEDIMRDADTAMYHAKSRGKARHEMFDADMHARERDRVGLENDLRHAVNTNGFELHYQPIVLLGTRMCVGFESLARWTRNGEPVSPAVFIPLAEELGIIESVGTWALQQACTTFADWKRRFPKSGLDYMTVNVSSRQLMQQNFLRLVEQTVHDAGLQPRDIRLEITETALMDNPSEAAKLLRELREFGTKIYLDDFGCGYSSLSHLAKLPVDVLKIDRSFVKNLILPDRPAIVESILALARTLKTGVVAEGIEHEAQAAELERLGCTHAQGYLFSKPLPSQKVEELIVAGLPLGPQKALVAPAPAARTAFDYTSSSFEWPEEALARSQTSH